MCTLWAWHKPSQLTPRYMRLWVTFEFERHSKSGGSWILVVVNLGCQIHWGASQFWVEAQFGLLSYLECHLNSNNNQFHVTVELIWQAVSGRNGIRVSLEVGWWLNSKDSWFGVAVDSWWHTMSPKLCSHIVLCLVAIRFRIWNYSTYSKSIKRVKEFLLGLIYVMSCIWFIRISLDLKLIIRGV